MDNSFLGSLFHLGNSIGNASRRLSRRISSLSFDHDSNNTYLYNPELLTEKERLSRIVYSQRSRKKTFTGSMYEQFIVVGLQSSDDKQSEILFQYPPDAQVPFPGIVQFCFPNGIPTKSLRRTPSLSNLFEMLCSHTQFQHASNSFIFMLTTESADTYYGVCVRNDESLEHNPSFIVENKRLSTESIPIIREKSVDDLKASPILNRVKKPAKTTMMISQKCYCFITRYPFFQLHFEILYGLLAMEHVYVMAHIQSRTLWDEVSYGKQEMKEKEPQQEEKKEKEESSSEVPIPPPPPSNESSAKAIALSFENAKTKNKTDLVSEVSSLLHRYRKFNVPNPGQSLEFDVPFMPQPLRYARPLIDEEEDALCDYSLPLFFYSVSLKHIFKLLSALMLEKKIAIISSNLRILSSVVLAFVPLLRPFLWQSILIPILPSHMYHMLEAPLPFLIGLTKMPVQYPSDVIIVNLESETSILIMKDPDIPMLPRSKEFENEFTKLYESLRKTLIKGNPPYVTSSKQLRISKHISSLFEKTLSHLFYNFRDFCMRDLTDPQKPVTVFIKEAFLDHSVAEKDLDWFKSFLETQMFFQFQDEKLRKEDLASKKQAEQRKGKVVL